MRKKATKRGKGGGGGSVEPTKTKPAAKPPAGWTAVESEFRREWESSPDRNRMTWAQAAAGFRYGWEAAGNPMTAKGKPMDEIEFDQLRRLVQHGWDRRVGGSR
jgi:hypothetical protein